MNVFTTPRSKKNVSASMTKTLFKLKLCFVLLRIQSELREIESIPSKMDDECPSWTVLLDDRFQSSVMKNHPRHPLHQNFRHFSLEKRSPEKEDITMTRNTASSSKNSSGFRDSIIKLQNTFTLKNLDKDRKDCGKQEQHQSPVENHKQTSVYLSTNSLNPNQTSSFTLDVPNTRIYPTSKWHQDTALSAQDIDKSRKPLSNGSASTSDDIAPAVVSHTRDSGALPNNYFCKYSSNPHSRTHCHHFPCVTPSTYHALGYRRNIKTQEATDTTVAQTNEDAVLKLFARNEHKNIHSGFSGGQSCTRGTFKDGLQSSFRNDTLLASNGNNCKSPDLNHDRPVNGPPFSPMPLDPINERVRRGMIKSHLPPERPTGRTSVRDKIRSLKHLVGEMRARNERSRPQEWSVKYGQGFPTRVLLNPVLPISL